MAEKVNDEGFAQIVVNSFMREQVAHIEEVPRMLAIERGHDLAGVEVSEADDGHFGEPEFFLHARRYRNDGGIVHATAQYRGDLDLDLRVVGTDDQFGNVFSALGRACADTGAGNPALDLFLDAMAENVAVLGTQENPEQFFPLAAALAVLENHDGENAGRGEKRALHRGITWSNSTTAFRVAGSGAEKSQWVALYRQRARYLANTISRSVGCGRSDRAVRDGS
jgi:hypothetical protein